MTTLQEAIRSVAANCPREDCRLVETGGVTTLDKHDCISSVDRNVYKSGLVCSTCRQQWQLRTQGDQTTISDNARYQSTA